MGFWADLRGKRGFSLNRGFTKMRLGDFHLTGFTKMRVLRQRDRSRRCQKLLVKDLQRLCYICILIIFCNDIYSYELFI